MITYETLRRIEQQERVSQKLSQLPDRFLQEALDYLKKKEEMSKEKGDKWEIQTAKQRFQNIMDLRERKIVNFALSFVRSDALPEDMIPEEKELLESIAKSLKDYHGRIVKIMTGEKTDFKTVAVLQQLPRFVGIDMHCYGPYQQGDIATIPTENARLLVEKGAAELVESG